MATVTHTTYDVDGNIVEQRDVEVPPESTNADTLHDRARQALTVNRAYAAKASPSAADNVAQIKALTRQNNGLIRLLLGLLDGTD